MPPTPYTLQRDRLIAAAPGEITAHLIDFHRWPAWSPWEDLDPVLERQYSGARQGVGAAYAWSGNRKAGRGRMEITEVAPRRVGVHVRFDKPFKATNQITFVLAPEGAGTRVTWRMDGHNAGLAKVVAKVVDMDKLLGKDFAKGLERLDRAVTGSRR